MRLTPSIHATDLGPKTAALTARLDGIPVAVVNERSLADPVMRDQAATRLLAAGFTYTEILDAIAPKPEPNTPT